MSKNKVLITGVNGFIGRSLTDYIGRKYPEWEVYGIDKKGRKARRFCQLDVRQEKELKRLILKIRPRYIFHLAGESSSVDFERLLLSNALGTFILFKVIRGIEGYHPRIVIPSSASEYGSISREKATIGEDLTPAPASLYGLSKMAQTDLSLFFVRQGLDIVIARIFNISGKGVPVNFSIGRFAYELAMMKRGRKTPRLNTRGLDAKRDFLDIEDVCAYLTVLAVNGRRGEIYNICRGRSYSIRSLLGKIINISSIRHVKIKEDSCGVGGRSHGDSFGSAKKIRRIARNVKLTPIEISLKAAYEYYLERI